jgi:hypothetical protein
MSRPLAYIVAHAIALLASDSAHAQPSAYDLTADIAARTAQAHRDVGAGSPVATVEQVFVVATPGGALVGPTLTTTMALEAFFHDRFAHRPAEAISVYIFPGASPYQAYCRRDFGGPCPSGFGFYSFDERRIVINAEPGIGTLVHELVHPIMQHDFPEAPDWINEGIASLYECFAFPKKGEIRGVTNWRLPRLLGAMHSPKEHDDARMDRLFGMSDDTFRGKDEDLHYALARYLCQWLEHEGHLWPFYRAWRDGYVGDPTGEKAFTSVVGESPAEANDAWARWVRGL